MHNVKFLFLLHPDRPHAHFDHGLALAKLGVIGKDADRIYGQIADGEHDLDWNFDVAKILSTDTAADAATLCKALEQAGLAATVRSDNKCRTAIEIEAEILKATEVSKFDPLENQPSPAPFRLEEFLKATPTVSHEVDSLPDCEVGLSNKPHG